MSGIIHTSNSLYGLMVVKVSSFECNMSKVKKKNKQKGGGIADENPGLPSSDHRQLKSVYLGGDLFLQHNKLQGHY